MDTIFILYIAQNYVVKIENKYYIILYKVNMLQLSQLNKCFMLWTDQIML